MEQIPHEAKLFFGEGVFVELPPPPKYFWWRHTFVKMAIPVNFYSGIIGYKFK